MKTSSFRRPRRFFSLSGGLAAVGVTVVLLLILVLRFFFPGTLAMLSEPLWSLGTAATARMALPENAETLRAERDALRLENEALRNENVALEAELASVGRVSRGEGEVIAGVLARPPITPYDVLVVSAGSRQGVTVGATAYAQGGIPVGTVTNVFTNRSQVTLYSATGQASEGWIGESQIPATVKGEGSGAYSVTVASDAAVLEGDSVYLPGHGATPIGTVARIEVHPSSPQAIVYVRPLVNPFTVTAVSIDTSLP